MEHIIQALRAYADACEHAALAERRTAMVAVGARKSAKARAKDLCKLLNLKVSEDDLYFLADYDKPTAPSTDKPYPNSRIVRLFSIIQKHRGFDTSFPMVAVRRRPKNQGFEAVFGYEDFGTKMNNMSQGYKWQQLIKVCDKEEDALAALVEKYGFASLREQKRKK